MVATADVADRTAAQVLLEQVARAHHLLALVWADGGDTGSLVAYCLVRDFGRRITSAEAMVYWSMILVMTRRLTRPYPQRG